MASLQKARSHAIATTAGRCRPFSALLAASIAIRFGSSLHVLLQGDECSVGIDIHQCNITADSGTPLLFGKVCSSAMMPCLRHACCGTIAADTNKGKKDALTIATSSTTSNPTHTPTLKLLKIHLIGLTTCFANMAQDVALQLSSSHRYKVVQL